MKSIVAVAILAISHFHCSAAEKKAAGKPILDITADQINGHTDGSSAHGNVRVVHRDATMKADHVNYERKANRVTLIGNVQFENPAGTITAEKLTYQLDNREIRTFGPSKTVVKDIGVRPR